ncbi:DNA-binding protein [Vibrio phage VPMS1]|uniref:DNA-binding protein n=1 Tax=Vibrio phage VPMS1 TaxID=1233488 RepID=UPI0003585D09|nr:DNA-binding protein [Vibrio phage VPMS1]AFV51118.1 DNA-binding protein [Vibrio phage VPMS1]
MAKPTPVKTPLGDLMWVVFNGEGKENLSGKLKYTADIVLDNDSEECKTLTKLIDDFWKDNKPSGFKGKAKTKGYRPEMRKVLDENGQETYDEDDVVIKEPTGRTVFTFTTDTTYPSGDPKVIKIYNAKGNPVNLGDKKIGNGSRGQISGAMGIYNRDDGKGVSLYLNAIRITKLEEFTQEEQWDDVDDSEGGWTGEDNWDAEDAPQDSKPEGGTPRL